MIKRRALAAFYLALVLAYLGFVLYFLTLRPGGPSGNQAVIWAITGFASGGMMMMAIYALTLHLFRRGEKALLYFALFCIGSGIRFLVMEGSLTLMELVPGVTYGMALGIRYPAIGLQVVGAVNFILEIFAAPKHKKLIPPINAAVAIVYAAAVIVTRGGDNILLINIVLLLLNILIEAYCIYTIIKSPELRRNRLNIVYLASYLLFAVISVFSALLTDTIPHLTVIAGTVFVVAHIILLSDRYARAIRDVEETNENLERIVDERTRDILNTNAAMKELMTNISHDLKTPLTIVLLNLEKLERLEREPIAEEYRRNISVARDKSRDLKRITQNLFEVSRIESGQSLYKPEWIPLRTLLPMTRTKYGAYLESKGLSFDIDDMAAGGEYAEIYADPERIWSVFDNIVYNAERHTRTGGVTITAIPREETADIIITDTGEGIAAEHLPRIFERFYKASPERGGGDNGVGLYIVKSVMEGCGGGVAAKSEPDKGASIILTFLRKAGSAR